MGLDITAYSHLRHVGDHTPADRAWCENDDHIEAYAYAGFAHALQGLPVYREVATNGARFLFGGCYETTDKTETAEFGGSYGGHGRFRELLIEQFNPGTDPDMPFYELIWFADNEGTIGEVAAMLLAADFRQHELAFQVGRNDYEGQGWVRRYEKWAKACELAAAGGLIEFH